MQKYVLFVSDQLYFDYIFFIYLNERVLNG